MTALLSDPYYSEAHEVFRRATNQTELMLDRLVAWVGSRTGLSICSVGSGAGLFEMPMLARLDRDGIGVVKFVGVDISEHACAVLERKLAAAEFAGLDSELVVAPFQKYDTTARFDLVLFNHVLEYLHGDALESIMRSQALLERHVEPVGSVMVFSPVRGGINGPYEEVYAQVVGTPPIFADDIEQTLEEAGIDYTAETMTAACDVSALDNQGDEDAMKLLSFLTQQDCREVSESVREHYASYYRALRPPGSTKIPHPVQLFVL